MVKSLSFTLLKQGAKIIKGYSYFSSIRLKSYKMQIYNL